MNQKFVIAAPRTAEHPTISGPSLRLTYAITPPNQTTAVERRQSIAASQSARISSLPIDALLVYDIQDETARNESPRPFPFSPKVDPLTYAYEDLHLDGIPRVVYRAVTDQVESCFVRWIERLRTFGGLGVLVGAPSRNACRSLTLQQAYRLVRSHTPELRLGGVLIAERHQISGLEDAHAWSKLQQGCQFFVSQTVWSMAATKQLLSDLQARAEQMHAAFPPLLLTLSPCGSAKTLEFQEWLGVSVPHNVKRELLQAPDMLSRSVMLAVEMFSELHDFAAQRGIAVGCNVESVSSRAEEVEAAVELVWRIAQLQARMGKGRGQGVAVRS